MLSTIAKEDLEKVNELSKIAFKISLIIGCLVMMYYYYLIGFFPYDLSIGDGLLFIVVAIAFGLIDMLFTTLLTCVGFKLRGVFLAIEYLYLKAKKKEKSDEGLLSITPGKTDSVIWIPAIFGTLLIIKLSVQSSIQDSIMAFIVLIISSWLCAHCISTYCKIKNEETINPERSNNNKKLLKAIYLIVFCISPLFIGGAMSTMSAGTMRIIKIRQDNTIVNIENPYAHLAVEAGAKGEASVMGKEYLRFEGVDVIYSGPGKYTVLRLHDINKKAINLIVPTEKVFILF